MNVISKSIDAAIWGIGKESIDLAKVIYQTKKDLKVKFFVKSHNYNIPNDVGEIITTKTLQDKDIGNELQYLIVPADLYLAKELYHIKKINLKNVNILVIDCKSLDLLYEKYGSFQEIMNNRKAKILYLPSLEYEVAHHCNLSCKGCNHFSPLQKEAVFGDLDYFKKDLKRLAEFVDSIGVFKLVGGEPLLNSDLVYYIESVKEVFPQTTVKILTNGILIRQMDERLKNTLKYYDVILSLTIYPPLKKVSLDIERYIKEKGLSYEIFHQANKFSSQINIKGNSNPQKAEENCYMSNCHIFANGKISKCPLTHKIDIYNQAFKESLPQCSLDLYDNQLTSELLHKYLRNPVEMCQYCGVPKWFSWNQAKEPPLQAEFSCRKEYL